MRGWTVGLDIGGTKVHGVLLDPADEPTATVRLTTGTGTDGVLDSAARAVAALVDDGGLDHGDLSAVGAGVPGVVDPVTGTVSHAVNLGIGGRVPLGDLLSARLGGTPVVVENDLNAAALGAARRLGDDLAYLALGTGVAAGIVLDGRLRRGVAGAAGEIGHLPYRPGGARCACGQHGCLELYASGRAIRARWGPGAGRPAALEVFEAAAAGDPKAQEIRDDVARAVAAAVRILVLTYDVARVVLGGGVSALGEPLRAAVVSALDEHAASSPFVASLGIGDRVSVAEDQGSAALGAALATTLRGTGPAVPATSDLRSPVAP